LDDKTSIGLVLTSFGAAMRDPVTMISCRGSDALAAGAVCASADMVVMVMATAAANSARALRARLAVAAPAMLINRLRMVLLPVNAPDVVISFSPHS
jgi:hypothetical protein